MHRETVPTRVGFSMRFHLSALALLALAACQPAVPDSGVGFESYPDYVRDREAGLQGTGPVPPAPGFGTPTASPAPLPASPAPAAPGAISTDALAAAGIGAGSRDSVPAGIARESGEMVAIGALPPAPVAQATGGTEPAGISDEQDFGAVSSRESIESDRERLARQRAAYEQIAPTALPTREGPAGPNIVDFAIRSTNRVGEAVYPRSNPFRNSSFERNCAKYPSQDLAQEDFLARGGPERDPRSLDPDGDGFACRWDPSPFRLAVR